MLTSLLIHLCRRKGFLSWNYQNGKVLCGNDAFGYRHIFERQQHFGGVYDIAVRQAITFVLEYRFPTE